MIQTKIILGYILVVIITCSCKKTVDVEAANIVINEIMAVNTTTIGDQNGEYDDWIELYNLSASSINLSGYYLSDSRTNLKKWQIPTGVSIQGNGYTIIWADKDTTQGGLHSNFKLSSLGEKVILSDTRGIIINEVAYPAETLELSYSRIPNGTGPFRWKTATFNETNGNVK
jgi:hypothetical protein